MVVEKYFMAIFYGWGLTLRAAEPLQGDSLHYELLLSFLYPQPSFTRKVSSSRNNFSYVLACLFSHFRFLFNA